MDRHNFRALLTVLAAVVVLGGCESKEQSLTVAFSNDMVGEIRSCGCASQDHGGLGRRATFLESHRSLAENFLLLEGGDFFGVDVNYGEEKAHLTLQAMAYMRYDGIVLGENDFSLGLAYIRDKVDKLGLPVVLANVYDAQTGELVFPASRIVKRGKVTIGITGAIAKHLELPESMRDSVRVEIPNDAIEREIAALRDKVDIIVVLGHMPTNNLRKLAEAFPDIDLVAGGHNARPGKAVKKFGNAWILQATVRGRSMGIAYIDIDADGKIVRFNAGLEPLTKSYVDHDAIVKLFKTYDMSVARKETERLAYLRQAKAEKPYEGAGVCQPCHAPIYEQWQDTKHAHAFEILEAQGRELDRDCLPCHTTGFFELGGFLSATDTPNLVGVQCENCHGNGHDHVEDPLVKTEGRSRTVCQTCHTEDQTPDFEFDTHWARIRH